MNNIPVYQPAVKVTLYKTIGRKTIDGTNPVSQRFIQTNQTLDLTAWLGEAGGFRTSKSIREPAGSFSITLADRAYATGGALESLYGLIEPQDFIEIRMRHNVPGSSANPSLPPVLMRGYVSSVRRSETMGQDGRPSRSITISGQDYGKLWQMLQILYLPQYVVGQDIISGFKLFQRFGEGFQTTMKAPDFVTQMVQKVVNPYLKTLMPANSPNPVEIKLDVSVTHGTTSVTGPQNQEGSIYNILKTYSDIGVWNELYMEDREDGVYCVYRPNPFLDINGNLIQSDAPKLTPVILPDSDIISLNVERSDANVANYYWVRAPRFDLSSDQVMRQQFAMQDATRSTVILDKYLNTADQYYGIRVMNVDTQQGGDDVTTFNSGQRGAQQSQRDTGMANWINDRREIMLNQNKDNVLLESGTIRTRANEDIRPGVFVKAVRGGFSALYYVVQVDTDYVPFQGLFATLVVERGTGFVERLKREGGVDSPYLAELTGAVNGS